LEPSSAQTVAADADQLMDDLETFARRQPWVIAGAGVLLGFAASRTLKAARSKRYFERYGSEYGVGTAGYASLRADEGPITAYGSP